MPSAYVTMYHPWQRNKQRPGQVSSGWPAEIWRGPADALAAGHALAAGAVASSAGATQVQRKAERGNKRARARLEQSQWLGDAGAACDGLAWPGPARPGPARAFVVPGAHCRTWVRNTRRRKRTMVAPKTIQRTVTCGVLLSRSCW